MAAVKLKRALLVEGKFYQPGVQEIPDAALKHHHFVRYIQLGIVVPPENEELEKLETPEERAKRLHQLEIDREARKQELLKKVEEPPAEPAPEKGNKKSKKG